MDEVRETLLSPAVPVRIRYPWRRLLDDVRGLVPEAQVLSLWVRRRQGYWRFQNGFGFEHPEALLNLRVHAFPLRGETSLRPEVLSRADIEAFPESWQKAYRAARPPFADLPRASVVVPWPEAHALFFLDAPTEALTVPSEEALRDVLAAHRDLAYNLTGWAEFHRAISSALLAFPRLLDLSPERLLQGALHILATMLPYDRAMAWYIHQPGQMVVGAAFGFPDGENPVGQTLSVDDSPLLQELTHKQSPIWMPETRFSWGETPSIAGCWLALPVPDPKAHDRLLGVLVVERDEPYGFLGDEIRLGERFAHVLGVYLNHRHEWEQAQADRETLARRTRHLESLYRFAEWLTQTLDLTHLWQSTPAFFQQALEAHRALVWEVSGGTVYMRGGAPQAPREAIPPLSALELSELLEYLREGRVLTSTHVAREPWLVPLLQALKTPIPNHVLVVPLGQGTLFQGFLWMERDQRFTAEDIELALTMGRQMATALHQARLFQTTRELTEQLEERVRERTAALQREQRRAQLLARVFAELAGSLDVDQILDRAQDVLLEGLDADQSMIVVPRPAEKPLFWRSGRGKKRPPYGGMALPIALDDPLAQHIMQKRVPLVLADTRAAPAPLEAWWQVLGRPYGSLAVVPMVVGVESVGALLLFRATTGPWDADDVEMLQTVAMQLALTVQNAEIFEMLQEQAREQGELLRRQQEESQRVRAILESVADGIVVTDAHMRIMLINRTAEQMLRLKADEVFGETLDHFIGLLGPQGAHWIDRIRTWSQNPASYHGEVAEAQIEMEDGRVLSVRMAPVFLRGRDFLGTVSVIRDITHHIEVDRMKSAFVANVSHELRTPLTAIKGYVEVLLQGMAGELPDQQRRFLNIIRNHTERLIVLVNDLLDLSKLEAGKIRLQQEKAELRPLLDDLKRDFHRRIRQENRDLTLTFEVAEDLPAVYVDPKRTTQILANLLENAVRYTPDGGHITLFARRWEKDPNFVLVAVKDTGIGIPPEEQGKVFERFYRGTHPLVLATPGTGLGLPIVKQLVEMQGGRIWLESTGVPGEGTTFYVTFPVYTGQQPTYVEKT